MIKSGDTDDEKEEILVSGPGPLDVGGKNATKYCTGKIVLSNRNGQRGEIV